MSAPCTPPCTPTTSPEVALYLDTYLSREFMAYVIQLCRDRKADLLVLAPPPGNLALSRLEPHLGALDQAGIAWRMPVVAADRAEALHRHAGIIHLVCESRSTLARYREPLPAPLLILLNPETPSGRARPETEQTLDWLAPRLHRSF